MKRIRKVFLLSFMIINVNALCQSNVTLVECQRLAAENYPLIAQYGLIDAAAEFTLDNISAVYLPQIQLIGQATYQTEVTKLKLKPEIQKYIDYINSSFGTDFSVETLIKTMPKDQYKAYLEATQVIYDGGQTGAGKRVARATAEVEKQKIAVSMYAIKQKVSDLYFGILQIDEQSKILELYYSDLQAIEKMVQSAVNNGIAMTSDLNIVRVEFLNLDQKKIELDAARNACISVLSAFIHRNLDENATFEKPTDLEEISANINRPELTLIQRQRELFDAQRRTITAQNLPTLGLFVQGGYGRPALNMLDANWQPYAIGGVQFRWNFGNLYNRKRDLNLVNNNLKILNVQEETFRFNTNLEMSNLRPVVEKFKQLIEKDNEIVELREQVRQTSQSKYRNGIYQMKDLIADTNAENLAKQTKSIHYVQYLKSLNDLKIARGE
ncbi:MAG: TolC family protein [Prevotellaceae bacterium]|jgi:outer membrane protein TolC|nr:TolC family protein [Prevotellaceae bacterium]